MASFASKSLLFFIINKTFPAYVVVATRTKPARFEENKKAWQTSNACFLIESLIFWQHACFKLLFCKLFLHCTINIQTKSHISIKTIEKGQCKTALILVCYKYNKIFWLNPLCAFESIKSIMCYCLGDDNPTGSLASMNYIILWYN